MRKATLAIVLLAICVLAIGCGPDKTDKTVADYLSGAVRGLLETAQLQDCAADFAFSGYRGSTVTCALSLKSPDSKSVYTLAQSLSQVIREDIKAFCGTSNLKVDPARLDREIDVILKAPDGSTYRFVPGLLTVPAGKKWSEASATELSAIEKLYGDGKYTDAMSRCDQFGKNFAGYEQETRVAELKTLAQEGQMRRLAASMDYMRSKTDEVQGITWYYDKTTPRYADVNNFHLYIGLKDRSPWLRMCIRYTAEEWLFIEKYIVSVDGTNYSVTPGLLEVERDNSWDHVWEWYDCTPTEDDLKMVRAIISSTKTILRCEGDPHYSDRTITAGEKKALQHVLDAYEYLKKKSGD